MASLLEATLAAKVSARDAAEASSMPGADVERGARVRAGLDRLFGVQAPDGGSRWW
jgi:hypothetical protein